MFNWFIKVVDYLLYRIWIYRKKNTYVGMDSVKKW